MRLPVGILLGAALAFVPTSGRAEPLVTRGERIVFMGDGYFGDHGATALVMDAYALHHPGAAVSARTSFVRYLQTAEIAVDTDVLSVKPAVAVVSIAPDRSNDKMFGPAYFGRFFLTPLSAVVQKLQAAGVKVILLTPAFNDPDQRAGMKGNVEKNVAQTVLAVREIAASTRAALVDIHAITSAVQARGKGVDPAFSLFHDDRTLSASGQAVVAGACLRALGEEGKASGLTIDARAGAAETDRCRVADLSVASDKISFMRTDEALPGYFPAEAAPVLAFDPLLAADEQYRLKVKGLKPGPWKVTAGAIEVGTFDADSLAEGVNLARRPGPWRQLGMQLHQKAQQQESLFADRCQKVARLTTPPEADAERLALRQALDAYIDAFEGERIHSIEAERTWTWIIERQP